MKDLGRVVPVHYQEPFRRGFTRGWDPTADDFVTDAKAALAGGAAGWCFHNGDERRAPDAQPRRSFDMRAKSMFDQLDDVEKQILQNAMTKCSSTRELAIFLKTSQSTIVRKMKKYGLLTHF